MDNNSSDSNNLKVAKSNALIEASFLESNTKLSLYSQRIILIVISQIQPEDEDFKPYSITIHNLKKTANLPNKNIYSEIHTICKNLTTSSVTIKEADNPNGFIVTSWCTSAGYFPDSGLVSFKISPEMKKHLLLLKKNFTTYHIKQVISLKSVYYIRIYELLRQFLPSIKAEKGEVSFREVAIEDLKKFIGVKEKSYLKYTDFKRFVIEKAREELIKNTDIYFDYVTKKIGKKVYSIKFHISHNEKFATTSREALKLIHKKENELLVNSIKSFLPDFNNETIELMLQNYKKEIIQEALLDLLTVDNNKNISNKKSYFKRILLNKAQEELEKNGQKTTIEKLMDTSWEDDDWLQKI